MAISSRNAINQLVYRHTLASVWALEKLEHSAGLLDVMAFLDPAGIPEEFLREAVKTAQLVDYPKSHLDIPGCQGRTTQIFADQDR
ncbi:hypothetical protein QBC34DRAFT_389279 [Podospora aff. communis PSN243]|uniref:DUF7779 domain-containing protein n=1 Tax=Podospora aff. communis PSN243 TaxID=3040156 RepID=A0AAV9H8T4_9PEZI|nr:hypothetical protein QBC34DRAFT_389279 [Podospora aff. communis PSN243]